MQDAIHVDELVPVVARQEAEQGENAAHAVIEI